MDKKSYKKTLEPARLKGLPSPPQELEEGAWSTVLQSTDLTSEINTLE